MRLLLYTLLISLGGLLCLSCESEYSALVKKEIADGEIYEDLILGLKMGQTKNDFFEICWDLNRQGIVRQGTGNKYALWITNLDSTSQKSQKVDLFFYGTFDSDMIMNGMEMKIGFTGWSIWSEDHKSFQLVEDLKVYFMKMYGGNEFIEIDAGDGKKVQVKVDGNRQIKLYPIDNKDVRVLIEDLRKLDGYGYNDSK